MAYSVLEITEYEVDLVAQAKSTGWTTSGDSAIHESCNNGFITVKNILLEVGKEYQVSWQLTSNSNGYTRLQIGDTQGINRNTPGSFIETLTASGDGKIKLYSTADAEIRLISYKQIENVPTGKYQSTIAFNQQNNKWTSFYTYSPDFGFSMFTNLYTFKSGQLYKHSNSTSGRCEFYGVQYRPILRSVFNQMPAITKVFTDIAIRSNRLILTNPDGIETSLGQISELYDWCFVDEELSDSVSQINIYDQEGEFKATFLQDKATDIIDGDDLRGSYITLELTTTDNNDLKLFSIKVSSKQSFT